MKPYILFVFVFILTVDSWTYHNPNIYSSDMNQWNNNNVRGIQYESFECFMYFNSLYEDSKACGVIYKYNEKWSVHYGLVDGYTNRPVPYILPFFSYKVGNNMIIDTSVTPLIGIVLFRFEL